MRHNDDGVYRCGKPECSVCWLYGPRTVAWAERVRAAYPTWGPPAAVSGPRSSDGGSLVTSAITETEETRGC